MAKTLVIRGVAGPIFLSLMHVEVIVPQTTSPRGEVSAVVRMVSGEDYVAYFDNRMQMRDFILEWAGDMIDRFTEVTTVQMESAE